MNPRLKAVGTVAAALILAAAVVVGVRGRPAPGTDHKVGGTYVPSTSVLPINLGGGAGVVTGTLPAGNQANQSVACSGDVACSGTTGAISTTVDSISSTSLVPVSGGSAVYWQLGALVGNSSYSALYPTGVSPNGSDYALASTSTSVLLNAPNGAGSIGFNVANGGVGAWTTSAFNVFSGGVIFNPWQGSKNSQTEQILHVPFVFETSDKSAHTVYTFSLGNPQSAFIDMVAIGRIVSAGGTPWDVSGAERTQHINADAYNNGTVTINVTSIYGTTGIANLNNPSGSTVNLTVQAAPAGSAPTVDFEGYVTIALN